MGKLPSGPAELLTIREASELFRVSASTLRRWSDSGLIPSSRTPGGHRRYSKEAIEGFAQQLVGHPLPVQMTTSYPLPLPEWHIPSEQLSVQPWHARLAPPDTAEAMRELGQRLVGLLIQYITRPQDDSRFLQDALEAGTGYGVLAGQCGASLRESVEAFIFFRKCFSQTSLQMPRVPHLSDSEEVIRFTWRINQFMDKVLWGLVSGYEAARISSSGAGGPATSKAMG